MAAPRKLNISALRPKRTLEERLGGVERRILELAEDAVRAPADPIKAGEFAMKVLDRFRPKATADTSSSPTFQVDFRDPAPLEPTEDGVEVRAEPEAPGRTTH